MLKTLISETYCEQLGLKVRLYAALDGRAAPALTAGPSPHLSDDLLEQYRFRNLTPLETEDVRKHLGSCRECTVRWESCLQFIRDLKAALRLKDRGSQTP